MQQASGQQNWAKDRQRKEMDGKHNWFDKRCSHFNSTDGVMTSSSTCRKGFEDQMEWLRALMATIGLCYTTSDAAMSKFDFDCWDVWDFSFDIWAWNNHKMVLTQANI